LPSPAVITIPLIGKDEHAVTQADVDEWRKAYPAVDVLQQLAEMRTWCNANTANRKTPRGVNKFIVGWLSREQDKGPRSRGVTITVPSSNQRDPELVRLELESAKSVPPPAAFRAYQAAQHGARS